MKKIFCLMVMFIFTLSLVACSPSVPEKSEEKNEDKTWVEPQDETTFEEYLKKTTNNLDSKKIDELFAIEPINFKFADIDVRNTRLEIQTIGKEFSEIDDMTGLLWKEESTVYANFENEDESQLIKLDLAELDEMLLTAELTDLRVSEVLSKLFKEKFNLDITLDEFLSKIKLDINDFEDMGDGVYALKLDAIAGIGAALSPEATSEEIIELIKQYYTKFLLTIKYENGKVRNVSFLMDRQRNDAIIHANEEVSFSLGFLYGEKGINGVNFAYNYSINRKLGELEYNYLKSISASISEEGIKFDFEINDPRYKKVIFNLLITQTEVNGKLEEFIEDEKTGQLTVDLKLDNGWIKSGKIIFNVYKEEEKCAITCSIKTINDIEIPTVDKTTAENVFDLIGVHNSKEPIEKTE